MKPYTKKDEPRRCPVCGKSKAQDGNKFKNANNHLIGTAKGELFERELATGKKPKTPHMDYIKTHKKIIETTRLVITISAKKR